MTMFRQLRDAQRGGLAYVLADTDTHDAVAIDVCDRTTVATLQALLEETGLRLRFLLETRARAETREAMLAARHCTGAAIVGCGHPSRVADVVVHDGEILPFGNEVVRVLATPGITPDCLSYLWRDRVFTGDCLWIGACAPIDADVGDAGALYDSVTRRLFFLPDETLVFPARSVDGRTVSTVAEERVHHPCFARRTRDEFVTERRRHATANQPVAGAAASTAHRARSGEP